MARPRRPEGRDPTGRPPRPPRPTRRPSARDPAAATERAAETPLDGDRGAVTVEAALALCSLVAVLGLAVAAVAGASAHLRCLDAAREAARLVARGEPDRAREAAAEIAPRGAKIAIAVAGDQVQVDVSTAVVPGLPGLSLDSRAVGVLEPAALLTSGGSTGPAPGAPGDPVVAGGTGDDPGVGEGGDSGGGDTGGGSGGGTGGGTGGGSDGGEDGRPVAGDDRPPGGADAPGGTR